MWANRRAWLPTTLFLEEPLAESIQCSSGTRCRKVGIETLAFRKTTTPHAQPFEQTHTQATLPRRIFPGVSRTASCADAKRDAIYALAPRIRPLEHDANSGRPSRELELAIGDNAPSGGHHPGLFVLSAYNQSRGGGWRRTRANSSRRGPDAFRPLKPRLPCLPWCAALVNPAVLAISLNDHHQRPNKSQR